MVKKIIFAFIFLILSFVITSSHILVNANPVTFELTIGASIRTGGDFNALRFHSKCIVSNNTTVVEKGFLVCKGEHYQYYGNVYYSEDLMIECYEQNKLINNHNIIKVNVTGDDEDMYLNIFNIDQRFYFHDFYVLPFCTYLDSSGNEVTIYSNRFIVENLYDTTAKALQYDFLLLENPFIYEVYNSCYLSFQNEYFNFDYGKGPIKFHYLENPNEESGEVLTEEEMNNRIALLENGEKEDIKAYLFKTKANEDIFYDNEKALSSNNTSITSNRYKYHIIYLKKNNLLNNCYEMLGFYNAETSYDFTFDHSEHKDSDEYYYIAINKDWYNDYLLGRSFRYYDYNLSGIKYLLDLDQSGFHINISLSIQLQEEKYYIKDDAKVGMIFDRLSIGEDIALYDNIELAQGDALLYLKKIGIDTYEIVYSGYDTNIPNNISYDKILSFKDLSKDITYHNILNKLDNINHNYDNLTNSFVHISKEGVLDFYDKIEKPFAYHEQIYIASPQKSEEEDYYYYRGLPYLYCHNALYYSFVSLENNYLYDQLEDFMIYNGDLGHNLIPNFIYLRSYAKLHLHGGQMDGAIDDVYLLEIPTYIVYLDELPNKSDTVIFGGWYDNPLFTGDPITYIDTNDLKELKYFDFYAKWETIE